MTFEKEGQDDKGPFLLYSMSKPVPGLTFRHFRGDSDYPAMLAIILSSAAADQIERHDTLEDVARNYSRLTNCDPYQDMIFAEIAGELVGYVRGWWWDEARTGRLYGLAGFLVPAWRRQGIGRLMQLWMEGRLREIAATHPSHQDRFFQVNVSQHQVGTAILLEGLGYQPVRYFYEMVRPSLELLPDFPLPAGLEIRPVLPEHYPAIWTSVDETSQDEWGYTPPTAEDYQAWLDDLHFQPGLWQVAWDVAAGRVAGHVLTFIDQAENEHFNRKRGYTEGIGVDRAWRRRGLARALIARSLQAQKAAGMTESALAADSDSTSGVIRLYESCGFQAIRRDAIYRKPL
jgi:GNAT superfamily N-acetyltransferase